MRYGQIRKYDVANGPGIRTSFFVTGCSANCKNCFNTEYMNPNYGKLWTEKETNLIIDYLKKDEIEGLTILGGEPFESVRDLIEIVRKIRDKSDKSIWIFSGFKYEVLINNKESKKLLSMCDVLVDGLFVEELKNLKLKFKGSSNQRTIDIQKSLEKNKICILDGYK
ncbi:anaerobic ribonucleoside-triphosphate reductase activating protein [Anaerococcus sp. AGMB00486]|uniref:Anaerobic ribonucleoside-triphosphate reductase-activating protein n=1 Tax=Anaerococcus faecalis TaxID=2742993 RepID=A0ABX2NB69_9FIRM|nr:MULTISPECIES: anaerobic ribonucleoside-triphosphate reductase activating protein [Anaerococcus]MDY3007045.1 anaerobic ribonucleoside-triphosphate reductase activating protein [Anaerococcus porci]NVF11933.1 anaerobic ribonucleoside-triphosphate reductase activating protein [Anaerococcus faecalis]